MSAQPSEHDSHDVIRLGGETAVVVEGGRPWSRTTSSWLRGSAAPG